MNSCTSTDQLIIHCFLLSHRKKSPNVYDLCSDQVTSHISKLHNSYMIIHNFPLSIAAIDRKHQEICHSLSPLYCHNLQSAHGYGIALHQMFVTFVYHKLCTLDAAVDLCYLTLANFLSKILDNLYHKKFH